MSPVSNVLTREQLEEFNNARRELERSKQDLESWKYKDEEHRNNWEFIKEQLLIELRKRVKSEEITDITGEIENSRKSLGETVDALLTITLQAIAKEFDTVREKLEDTEREKSFLQKDLAGVKAQLVEAEESNSVSPLKILRGRDSRLEKEINEQNKHIRSLTEENTSLKSQLRRIQNEFEKLKGEYTILQGGLVPSTSKPEKIIAEKMTESDYDKVMGRLIKYVPVFSGERSAKLTKEALRFIDCCKDLHSHLTTKEQEIFMSCIKFRLSEDAYYLVSTEAPRTLDEMEEVLRKAYIPRKTLHELRSELDACKQRPGETLEEFADRMNSLLVHVKQAVSVKYPQGDKGLLEELEADAVATFKKGIYERLTQQHLVGRKFASLKEAKQEAEYYERDAKRMSGSNRVIEDQDVFRRSEGNMHFRRNDPGPAMYSGQNHPGGEPRGSMLTCNACGRRGHFARECPDRSSQRFCVKCRSYGHSAFNCRQPQQRVRYAEMGQQEPPYDNRDFFCTFCNMGDHYTDNCLKKYLAENVQGPTGNEGRQSVGASLAAEGRER